MATALQVINGALQKIQVKTAGVDLQDNEIDDAIPVLNDMMLALDRSGIRLNYTIVTDKSDDITSPDWSIGFIKAAFAIMVAPEYGAIVSAELRDQFNEMKSLVLNSIVSIIQPILPSTLPTGAGHGTCSNGSYYNSRYFYNTQINDILFGNGQNMEDDEGVQLTLGGHDESR